MTRVGFVPIEDPYDPRLDNVLHRRVWRPPSKVVAVCVAILVLAIILIALYIGSMHVRERATGECAQCDIIGTRESDIAQGEIVWCVCVCVCV